MLATYKNMDGFIPDNASASRRLDPAVEALHRSLATFNRTRLSPSLPLPSCQAEPLGEQQSPHAARWKKALATEYEARLLEGGFVEHERARVGSWAAQAPMEPDAFVAWFEALAACGPGQNDPLFPWLAQSASREQMKWFLRQEAAGEAGFDDLVALTQLKLPTRAKLELARNYWDEMGQGRETGMHGPMLQRLCTDLELTPSNATTVWESLALGNLMVALAANRLYTYHSIGALGIIEQTAPGRAVQVNAGLKRLGCSGETRRYFALHATLDVKHSEAWNREVIAPLVAAAPECAPAIAEGALMRLLAGQRCFERYRRELGFSSSADSHSAEEATARSA